MDASYTDEMTYNGENVLVVIEGLSMYLSEPDIRQIFSIIESAFQNATVLIETMSPFVVSHIKEKSIMPNSHGESEMEENFQSFFRLLPI